MRPRVRLRDYAVIEHFVLDYARYPELPGARSRWVLVRNRAVILAARARTARSPWESGSAVAWRRRTAAETLVRVAKLSGAARQVVQQTASKVTR
jgi:hypothetical protein